MSARLDLTRPRPRPRGERSIMASRKNRKDIINFYPTPPWATRALMEHVFPRLVYDRGNTAWSVWEPACGEGHMSEVLKEYFGKVHATDIYPYYGCADLTLRNGIDFLVEQSACRDSDWIITNPPFGDNAIPFILQALKLARIGVAMFLRAQVLEGQERFEKIFKPHPPTLISFFSERVPLCKGRWNPDGTTATAYCWLVWMKDRAPMAPFWIPPGQREALTRPDDRARFAAWSMPEAEAAE